MQNELSQDSRRRERVAANVYRRRTKAGELVYEAVFRDVDGVQRRKVLDARSERAAIKEARALLAQRDGGERVVAAELTLDELADRDYFPMLRGLAAAGLRSERNVDDDRDRYRLHVQPELGAERLERIEPQDVARVLRAMREHGYAESTIANVLGVIRGLYRHARSRGYVSRSPIDGLDAAELPKPASGPVGRVLDETELAALVRHAPDGYRAGVTLLAYSGLRLSEALGLLWRDVDLVEGELEVRGQLTPTRRERKARRVSRLKSHAGARTVPIFPALERELVGLLARELAAGRGRDDDPVLCSRVGTPLNQRNLAVRGVEAAAAAAGLGKVTPQDLRRSFCSLAGRRRVDPVEAAQLTGHSLAVWTRNYARSFGKAQRDEARARMLEHGFGAADELALDAGAVGSAATALPPRPPAATKRSGDEEKPCK
jgi:integrase